MTDIAPYSCIFLYLKVLSWLVVGSVRGFFVSVNRRLLCLSGVSVRRWEHEQEEEAEVREKLREPA